MVTVIINTVNENPQILDRAVQSYLKQSVYTQIIISTIEGDPSIGKYEVEYAIMKKKNHPGKCPKGSFMQLNNALELIRGDWFCFASGNDYAHPNKFQLEIKSCLNSGKEVCYSSFYYDYGDRKKVQLFHNYDRDLHQRGNFVSDCALISKRLVDKYLPFDISHRNYAYWDLWLRIYEGEGNVFVYNSVPTWYYVQRADDMHSIRRLDHVQINEAVRDRDKMLKTHEI